MNRSLPTVTGLLALIPGLAFAQLEDRREGFGMSAGLGLGNFGASCAGCASGRDNGLSGYARAGVVVTRPWFVGGEVGFWLKESGGVSSTFLHYSATVQWYPMPGRGLFTKAGLGVATYHADDGLSVSGATAMGGSIGAGFDMRGETKLSLSPYVNWLKSAGRELQVNGASAGVKPAFDVIQIGLGVSWH